MKSLLVCHHDAPLNREALARWLSSFSNLVGILVLQETRQQRFRRYRRELKRVGLVRFADIIAFRAYYQLLLVRRDATWENKKLTELCDAYPAVPRSVPSLVTSDPNDATAAKFIAAAAPDVMIARCKVLLAERIFTLPSKGTFVMHPGICPEYRNAHGCFWALANDDLDNVGMTLLKIDRGIDTGPVYGYYTYDFDEVNETHITIMHRVVFDNLDALKEKLLEIGEGKATIIDTSGRRSEVWGQPWLTKYIGWKRKARRRHRR
jgi:methionyl-tRNA formyltransferase